MLAVLLSAEAFSPAGLGPRGRATAAKRATVSSSESVDYKYEDKPFYESTLCDEVEETCEIPEGDEFTLAILGGAHLHSKWGRTSSLPVFHR